MWRAFGGAAVVLGVALVADVVFETTVTGFGAGDPWAGSTFAVAGVVFSSLLYRGVIIWNPRRSDDSDSGDWLNGVCAVLVSVALGDLAVRGTGVPMASWSDPQTQIWLGHLSVLMILGGSAVTVARLRGAGAGGRAMSISVIIGVVWLLYVALAFLAGIVVVERFVQLAWLLVLVVVAICSMRPAEVPTEPAGTSQSATLGALVVIFAGCVVLALDGLTSAERWSTVLFAAAAIAGSGLRMLHLIRVLSQLGASRREARTNDLTGLASRRALALAVREVEHGVEPAALLSIDLDRSKEIDDRHGQAVGDEVLSELSVRIQGTVQTRSVVARQGGDEFAVLLTGDSVARSVEVAHATLEACGRPVQTTAGLLAMSISVGIATTDFGGRVPGELLRCSDAAMYTAKQARSGVAVFDRNPMHVLMRSGPSSMNCDSSSTTGPATTPTTPTTMTAMTATAPMTGKPTRRGIGRGIWPDRSPLAATDRCRDRVEPSDPRGPGSGVLFGTGRAARFDASADPARAARVAG